MTHTLQAETKLSQVSPHTWSKSDLMLIGLTLNVHDYLEAMLKYGIVRSLDPATLIDPPWCRIETLDRKDLEELKEDIQRTGKNEIPILVHTTSDGRLEVIYGARRVQACRELRMHVVAQCIEHQMTATEVFRLQEVENHNRAGVSAYECAKRYHTALSVGLFTSQRTMAPIIGKSQAWISSVLRLLALPLEVVHAFDRLSDLQPEHAKELEVPLEKDRNGVISRAQKFTALRDPKKIRSGKETMRYLLGAEAATNDDWQPLHYCGREVGRWKCNKKGETTVRITRKLYSDEIDAIAKLVADGATARANLFPTGDK